MTQYDPKFDLKINVSHSNLHLQSSNFALYLEENLIVNIIVMDYESV